jgi:hypothetical protein
LNNLGIRLPPPANNRRPAACLIVTTQDLQRQLDADNLTLRIHLIL